MTSKEGGDISSVKESSEFFFIGGNNNKSSFISSNNSDSFLSTNNESWYSDFVYPILNGFMNDDGIDQIKLGPIVINKT